MRLSRKKKRDVRRGGEPFMSLIQVVQGHRAQCTLVDCSPRIHRSFLFPDMVHAALPRGAWQCVTLCVCVCVCLRVAPGPKPPPISTSCRLQTLRAPRHSSWLPLFVNRLYDTADKHKLHLHKVALDTINWISFRTLSYYPTAMSIVRQYRTTTTRCFMFGQTIKGSSLSQHCLLFIQIHLKVINLLNN